MSEPLVELRNRLRIARYDVSRKATAPEMLISTCAWALATSNAPVKAVNVSLIVFIFCLSKV